MGDASLLGTCAVACAVMQQPSVIKQELIASKSRLSKKQMTIPRLELVAAQMVANLAENIRTSLQNHNIREVYGWSDSTVVLHWLQGNESYKQFVHNRAPYINSKSEINWKYVDPIHNPADLGSRGCYAEGLTDEWWDGPSWLANHEEWPEQMEIIPTRESEKEAELIREVMCLAAEQEDEFNEILHKHNFWKVIRITPSIFRFITKCKNKEKLSGPLDTAEAEKAKLFWIKHEQQKTEKTDNFEEDQACLNLQKNNAGIYQCMGRIQGQYPLHIPRISILAEKIVHEAQKRTIHGGVILTMAAVRENYWIPKLQQLTKRVIRNCFGCKRFQVKPFVIPPQGQLPIDRTTGSRPFQVIGTDFAGPIMYHAKNKKGENTIHSSLHLQFNKSDTLRIVTRSNQRRIHQSIKEINCKTWISRDNVFR